MRYSIDMAIFGMLPGFTRAVLMARDVDNTENAAASRNMLRKALEAAGSTFANRPPSEHPRLEPWRRAYEAFGIRDLLSLEPSQPAIPKPLFTHGSNTPLEYLVNAYALQKLIPAGADDLSGIDGNVWLRPARGTELFVPYGHPERAQTPDIGEIVYVDDGPNVLRRQWHGQIGDTAQVTSQTCSALIYLDSLLPVQRREAEQLADGLTKLVGGFLGGQVETHFLTREQPAIDIRC